MFEYDIAIIGLGYVRLPLAREAAAAGLKVVGFDINEPVVSSLNAGRSHVDDLDDDDIARMLSLEFRATTNEQDLTRARALVICVPTPLSPDGGPDLGPVRAATSMVARVLAPGMLVVLESTTYPGTTDELIRPALEAGGLTAGIDFFLAFSPERVDPGNERYGIRNTPKVVGGCTDECTERAYGLYSQFVDTVVRAKGTREAETAKLLENTYRHINIALVNEMARFCHDLGIDLWDVIRLASTKPFGFQPFYPGPGVGGHCIPIDPNYLSYSVRTQLGYPFRFVELAQEINGTMPVYVARRAQDILNTDGVAIKGAKVLLLGVTYKPDIADRRESPAVELARALEKLGAQVAYHDPYVATWSFGSGTLESSDPLQGAVESCDLTILVQNHRTYDVESLVESSRRFFDTRGATSSDRAVRL